MFLESERRLSERSSPLYYLRSFATPPAFVPGLQEAKQEWCKRFPLSGAEMR